MIPAVKFLCPKAYLTKLRVTISDCGGKASLHINLPKHSELRFRSLKHSKKSKKLYDCQRK